MPAIRAGRLRGATRLGFESASCFTTGLAPRLCKRLSPRFAKGLLAEFAARLATRFTKRLAATFPVLPVGRRRVQGQSLLAALRLRICIGTRAFIARAFITGPVIAGLVVTRPVIARPVVTRPVVTPPVITGLAAFLEFYRPVKF